MFRQQLQEGRKLARGVDFNHNRVANPYSVRAENFETPFKSECFCDGGSERHSAEIVFTIGAAKALLEIDVIGLLAGKFPLFDQLRPEDRLACEFFRAANWTQSRTGAVAPISLLLCWFDKQTLPGGKGQDMKAPFFGEPIHRQLL